MSLFRSSARFAAGTVLSRLSGLLREVVIAWAFGAGVAVDAFVIANRIPNLLRELLAEGALGSSFTKVFSSLHTKDPRAARIFYYQALFWFSLITLGIALLGMLAAPQLVDLLTFFRSSRVDATVFFTQAVGLTRVLFPFLAFMSVGSIAAGVLHHHGAFFLSAISPIALNCGYIAGALVFAQGLKLWGPTWISTFIADPQITGLALGVLCGGFLHMLLLLWGAWQHESDTPSFLILKSFSEPLQKTLTLMLPMIAAGSAGQVNVLLNSNFATSAGPGAIAWLNYAFRILQLPIGVFAIGVSVAALPSLSRSISRGDGPEQLGGQLFEAINLVFWLVAPCFCFLAVNAEAVTQLLFQQGSFSSHDASMTGQALYYYSFALFGYGAMKVLNSYYYACDRTRFPMWVSLTTSGAHLGVLQVLTTHFGFVGIAIGSAFTLSCNALLLGIGLRPERLIWPWRQTIVNLLVLAASGAVALIGQYHVRAILTQTILANFGGLKLQAFAFIFLGAAICALVFAAGWWLTCYFYSDRNYTRR